MGDEFKTCPFCKEQIRKEAVKCRFCGEWLDRAGERAKDVFEKSAPNPNVEANETPPPIFQKSEDTLDPREKQPSQVRSSVNLQRILNIASIFLLATCLALIFGVLKGVNVSSERVGIFTQKLTEVAGKMLIVSGIVGWMCRSWSGKRKGVGLFAFSIALLLCSIIFVSNFNEGANRERQRLKEESRLVSERLMDLVGQATNGTISQVKSIGNTELDIALQPLLGLMQEFSQSLEQMNREISSLQQEDVFSTLVLSNKSNIQSEITKSISAQNLIKKYQNQFPAMEKTARGNFDGLKMSEDIKRGAIKGFEEALAKQRPLVGEMFDLRTRREEANQQFLQFMLGAFADYQVRGEKISFKTSAGMEKYSSLVKDIQDVIRSAEEFQGRQLQAVEAAKVTIKDLAK